MATRNYFLTCLSPVHIGTGRQFTKLDGLYSGGKWWLVDLDKTLASGLKADDLAFQMNDSSFSWSKYLSARRLSPSNVSAHGVDCPRDPGDIPIREAIKDVYLQPYIPGASIKGAIRTAVLWQLINQDTSHQAFTRQYLNLCVRARDLHSAMGQGRAFQNPDLQQQILARTFNVAPQEAIEYQRTLYEALEINQKRLRDPREAMHFQKRLERLGQRREWVSQPIERAVFGADPNHDLMRSLHVTDSKQLGRESLRVGLIWTYTLRANSLVEKNDQHGDYRVYAEWLNPNARTMVAVRTDEYLFGDEANKWLGFRGAREHAIRDLQQTCNEYYRAVIRFEKEFYAAHDLEALEDFYSDLEDIMDGLPKGAFLLNIGWGGGWELKTLGHLLKRMLGKPGFDGLRRRFRLGEDPRTHEMHLNAPFPHTRHVAYYEGTPRWPMGWIVLDPVL
jgi:CRISPR-associated protein Csm5